MSTPISSVFSNAGSAASNVRANPAPAQKPQPAPKAATDTVQLTEAQQVYQLYNQGLQVSQIATNLSLSVAAVTTYLSVTSSTG